MEADRSGQTLENRYILGVNNDLKISRGKTGSGS